MTFAARLRTSTLLVTFALLAAGCPNGSSDERTEGAPEEESSIGSTESAGSDAAITDSGDIPAAIPPDPDPTLLPVDEAVRIGTLDSGVTYYVRSNSAPGTRLELRLVVHAGSLQQEVPDSGLAHFVEHMLFNGTEAFTGNELDLVLQGFGLQIGADLNAYTSYGETVYSLSVPTTEVAVDTGFDVLAQWATSATLDETAVVEERGVVREEHRLRDESADGVIFNRLNELYTADSAYEGYEPIGAPEEILATTSVDTRRFYDRWYRPDLMAVVAVGDLPAAEIEAEIIERFADLDDRSDGAERTSFETVPVRGEVVDVVTHPDAGRPSISLDLPIPVWDGLTVGGDRLQLLESVIDRLISARLEQRIDDGSLEAILNGAGAFQIVDDRRFLGFNVTGDDLVAAAEGLLTELRLMQLAGFSENELARGVAAVQAGLDRQADSLESRQDWDYASQYVGHFLGESAIDDFDDRYRRQSAELADFSVDEVTNHLRFMLADSDALLVAIGADPAELPTVDQLQAALDRSSEVSVTEPITEARTFDELMAVPDPVDEIDERAILDLDGVEWTFENGARVLFMPSDIHAGNFEILGLADGGWSTLEPGDGPLADLATKAVNRSGLGALSAVELEAFLADTSVSIGPYIDETAEVVRGSAAIEDAEVLFQLLHLLVTEPRVDPAAFREAVEIGRGRLRQLEADPSTRSFAALNHARYGASPWHRIAVDAETLDNLTAADLETLYRERFDDVDDLVLAVAGDLSEADVVELARTYIGTLPTGDDDSWIDRQDPPPEGIVTLDVDAGLNGAGAGVDLLFTGEVLVNERTRLTAEIVQNIVQARLFETVREELGATYGGQVYVDAVTEPDSLIESLIVVSGDPERLDEIHGTVLRELEQLVRIGPSADEVDRARRIALSDHELIGNLDLIDMLQQAADGDPVNYFEVLETIESIRRAEIAGLAGIMFPPDQRIQSFRR